MNPCPSPGHGFYADGYEFVATTFSRRLGSGSEIGAGLCIYQRGKCVVNVWGGLADVKRGAPWNRDTRCVVFSASKGLVAMAFALLADRNRLDYDAPVATYWPEFAQEGKEGISVRTLLNHRAGLTYLDERPTMDDCTLPGRRGWLASVLERQRPHWKPGTVQGYHYYTLGLYARELFERIAGESMGTFLARELFDPLGADLSLGTPPSVDARIARVYYAPRPLRYFKWAVSAYLGDSQEARLFRALVARDSLVRKTLSAVRSMNETEIDRPQGWRAELGSCSATASAEGLARAYLPFAAGGTVDGRVFLKSSTLTPFHVRQGWSEQDSITQKALGWSGAFLKEEPHIFSPTRESFGHLGGGGSLGWCDPVKEIAIGYVMNRHSWRMRSLRSLALCSALYECEPVRDA
jgi:CubicO group peptidase (beta-lactamase class C family)